MSRTPSGSTIGIIGLGYVGLPLAAEFGKKYPTIGFDIKQTRIDEFRAGHDRTREVEPLELRSVGRSRPVQNTMAVRGIDKAGCAAARMEGRLA